MMSFAVVSLLVVDEGVQRSQKVFILIFYVDVDDLAMI